MKINKLTLNHFNYPKVLKNIPDPPQELYITGVDLNVLLEYPVVAIVGSRKVSAYGKGITIKFASELARAGITVVSGLAIGVDAIAHRAALGVGGTCIAILPAGLDRIYPSRHYQLAQDILKQGGALVSEYPPNSTPYKQNFIARNRIASGISSGVLITEAAEKSGSLHTARFALEQGREVMAIPGNITSSTSAGTNNLIKSGAAPVTNAQDVLHILGITNVAPQLQLARSDDPAEQTILTLLQQGIDDADVLLKKSGLDVTIFNQTLTMLEIQALIRPLGNNHWSLQ